MTLRHVRAMRRASVSWHLLAAAGSPSTVAGPAEPKPCELPYFKKTLNIPAYHTMRRARLLRTLQLRCSAAGIWHGSATAEYESLAMAGTTTLSLPGAATPPPSPVAWSQQQTRGISAASVLLNELRGGSSSSGAAAGGGSGSGSAQPPGAPPAEGVVAREEGEEYETDDEAEAAMAEAFERLIQAAFEMVQQGKPMEADYVLTEGMPGWWWYGLAGLLRACMQNGRVECACICMRLLLAEGGRRCACVTLAPACILGRIL